MKLHPTVPTVLVLATTVLIGLTGCGAIGGTTTPAGSVPAGMGSPEEADSTSAAGSAPAGSSRKKAPNGSTPSSPAPKKSHPASKAPAPEPQRPRIVSFKVAQKPKCAEGTAVFRAEAVPLIIKWKITGADSAALSVDDPTGTPGTYGAVELEGTQEFTFSCAGAVGSTETHTYAIYTVGGGTQKHRTLKVSAKVLDKGIGTD